MKGFEFDLPEFADNLFRIGAIKFGAFKLKLHEQNPEAPLSPIYVDLRIIKSDPPTFYQTIELLENAIAFCQLKFDLIADIPTASTPFVSVIAFQKKWPMISPKISKTHGLSGDIDGIYQQGQTALLCDDLITKADSKIEAANVLEKNGLIVKDILVLIDRQQRGMQALQAKGYRLRKIFNLPEFLYHYQNTKKITPEQFREVMGYLGANA